MTSETDATGWFDGKVGADKMSAPTNKYLTNGERIGIIPFVF